MTPKILGDVRVQSVVERAGPYRDPLEMYPKATPEIVERHVPWMAPECFDADKGVMIFAFQSFVLRTPRQTILIDTCVGNDKDRPGRPDWHRQNWPWMDNLRAAGVAPEEIDVVMCTHLHVDHVGWNTRLIDGRWVPTFPNASYLFARAEWDFWLAEYETEQFTDDPFYEDSLKPVLNAGQMTLIDGVHEVDDWVRIEPSPGHTPGHVCIRVASGDSVAVMSGDLMHHPVQCGEPDWNSCFCVDDHGARNTRRAFLDKHAETDTLIMPAHFPTPSAGRIKADADRFRFEFDSGDPAA